MKLIYAYMTLGEPRVVAAVDDERGHVRKVNVRWMIGPVPDAALPPEHWADSARGEVDYQLSLQSHPDPLRRFR